MTVHAHVRDAVVELLHAFESVTIESVRHLLLARHSYTAEEADERVCRAIEDGVLIESRRNPGRYVLSEIGAAVREGGE